MPQLTEVQIATLLTEHPAWRLEDRTLVCDLVFLTFPDAIAFLNRLADLAEQADHHPDITLRYNKLRLELISHDVAALTHRDAAMVRRLQTIL